MKTGYDMGTRDQTQVIRRGCEDPLPPEPTVLTSSVDHSLDVVWKGYALQMWLCVLVLLFLFICLAFWQSLKKLSLGPAPRSWPSVLSWWGGAPEPLPSAVLCLWKHSVTKDLLGPSLPFSISISFSKSRSLSVCV